VRAAPFVLLVLFLVSVGLMWLFNPDRSLEWELTSTTERYMVELGLTPTHYTILVADDVTEGAAVMREATFPGRVLAMFLYDLEYMSKYPPNLRKVIVAHEVGHLAPICNVPNDRLSRELCADYVSLALVPYKDVLVAMAWHLAYPSSPVVEAEFRLRLQAVLSYAQPPPTEPSFNLVGRIPPDWWGWSERKEGNLNGFGGGIYQRSR